MHRLKLLKNATRPNLLFKRYVLTDRQHLRSDTMFDIKPIKQPPGHEEKVFIPMKFLLTDNQFYAVSAAIIILTAYFYYNDEMVFKMVDKWRGLKPEDISKVPLDEQLWAIVPKVYHDARGPFVFLPPEFEEMEQNVKARLDTPFDYSFMKKNAAYATHYFWNGNGELEKAHKEAFGDHHDSHDHDARLHSPNEEESNTNSTFKHSSPSVIKAHYVLLGGGTASQSAAEAIKKKDPYADAKDFRPYVRPPLSKELWFTNATTEKMVDYTSYDDYSGEMKSIFYWPETSYESVEVSKPCPKDQEAGFRKIRLMKNTSAIKLFPQNRLVQLRDGRYVMYKQLLIATGGSPKELPFVKDKPELRDKISTFRNFDDFSHLISRLGKDTHIAIVGGGLLGSELASALSVQRGKHKDLHITQIVKEEGVLYRYLPAYLSRWITSQLEKRGIDIVKNALVSDINLNSSGKLDIKTSSGDVTNVDHIVTAIGINPNNQLAANAGLEIDKDSGGIVVNSELMAKRHIYVAGDAASFYHSLFGRIHEEHYEHARYSGQLAGENMCSKVSKSYSYPTMFWTDLGKTISMEIVGKVDKEFKTVSYWAKPQSTDEKYSRGLVFYIDENQNRIMGILLFNLYERAGYARRIVDDKLEQELIPQLIKRFDLFE